jgi:SAM-dependent methyltransferase
MTTVTLAEPTRNDRNENTVLRFFGDSMQQPSLASGTFPSAIPPNFHKGASRTWHQRRRHKAVLKMLAGLRGEVLDYGCGYGDLTEAIARTHLVQGVDVDPERVAFAAREYAPLRFSVCGPRRLDFADGSFDIVTSVAVIHFAPDPAEHLREVRRVLRDGGSLLLVCSNVQKVYNFYRSLLGRGPFRPPMWIAPEDEIRELVRQAGFEVTATGFFYDPPFEGWKSLGDVCLGLTHQVLSLLRVRATSSYFILLARKVCG